MGEMSNGSSAAEYREVETEGVRGGECQRVSESVRESSDEEK
jgi:hypothetical protein